MPDAWSHQYTQKALEMMELIDSDELGMLPARVREAAGALGQWDRLSEVRWLLGGHIECVANMLVVPSLLARSSETQALQTLLASLRYVKECLVWQCKRGLRSFLSRCMANQPNSSDGTPLLWVRRCAIADGCVGITQKKWRQCWRLVRVRG